MSARTTSDGKQVHASGLSLLCAVILACGGSGGPATPLEPEPPPEAPAPADPAKVVMIDQAHHNFHIASGRYAPFAAVVESIGYRVLPSATSFNADSLARGRILVIANALHQRNIDDWWVPTPSAFTSAEIAAVKTWVEGGGSLLLIADHMPFPGAAEELAAAFGVTFHNGFANDTRFTQLPSTCLGASQILMFRRGDGSLAAHPITDGRNATERIDSVGTFTGQAFEIGAGASTLLTLGSDASVLLTDTAWVFSAATTQVIDANGLSQGAAMAFGNGRVAVFGEAAMYSTQTCNGQTPMGFNAPRAAQNQQLAKNVVRWLAKEF